MTPAPGNPTQASRAPQQVRAGLTQVLTAILGPWQASGHNAKGQALLAATTILPAVLSLTQLRQQKVLAEGWDTVVHRTCRTRFPQPPIQATGDQDHPWWHWPSRTQVEVVDQRGGWRLIRATTTWTGPGQATPAWRLRVDNQLAQRLAPPAPNPPGQWGKAGRGPERVLAATPEGGAFTLEAQHVAQWARASGDDNAIHTQPGLAHRLGLEAGEREVVAHGLLLAALSLAQEPVAGKTLEARFHHPLCLPADGAPVPVVVDATAGLWAAGVRLLERRPA